MKKMNFFKKLPQRLFPWFIGICTVLMFLDASKKLLNLANKYGAPSIPYDEELAETEAPAKPLPEEILKDLDVKPKPKAILNSDALRQLNESIRAASSAQTKA